MFSRTIVLPSFTSRFSRRIGLGSSRLRRSSGRTHWYLRRASLGVEICGSSLYLACVRPGWRRRWLVATGSIANFSQLSVDQLGAHLDEFSREAHVEEPTVIVGLPRCEAIIRLLELPGVVKESLRETLELQVGLYAPTDEGDFYWDAATVTQKGHLMASLALLPRAKVQQLAQKFSAAGYPLTRLTVTQLPLARLISQTKIDAALTTRLLCLDFRAAQTEIAAMTQGRLVYSRSSADAEAHAPPLEEALLSEVQQALVALHWRKNEEPLDIFLLGEAPPRIESVLAEQGRVHRPGECGQFGGEFGSESEIYWGAIALALDGNVQWGGSSRLNLLPAELRPKRRRWQYAPTYALLGANAVLSAALMMGPIVHRQLLLRQYQQEMGRVAKVATDVDRVQQRQKPLHGRLELLDAFQMHGRQPLDALSEIAQKLTPDAWLTQFSFRQRQIEMVGSAKEAAELLRALQRSPQFEEVKFDGALTRDSSGTEHFRLRMRLKANP